MNSFAVEFIKDNPTVVVSIGAAFFTFLTTALITIINYWVITRNLEKQLKVQVVTTVEKEWVNDLRRAIVNVTFAAHLLHINGKSTDTLRELIKAGEELKVLLDLDIKEEKDLYIEVSTFANGAVDGKVGQPELVWFSLQRLLRSKKNLSPN